MASAPGAILDIETNVYEEDNVEIASSILLAGYHGQ